MAREVNQAGIDLIKEFEGTKLSVYDDGAGYLTVGIGHKLTGNEDLYVGDAITQKEVDDFFQEDLANAADIVSQFVVATLTDNQFSALVSFVFNVGKKAFSNSHMLLFLNVGDFDRAANQFECWIFSGGKVSNGLSRRRAAEKDLFLTPDNNQT